MADTAPTQASTDTGRPTAASTSSTPTDESQQADPLVALGERILAELGDPRTNNTLARWLAHHTARLILAADKAREAADPDAEARDAEAREAILQLWQARATWPDGWPPPRAAEIARLLDELPDLGDEGRWYRQTVLAHLQDVHHHVLAVLVDLVTDDGSADAEQGWLDTFGDQLTSDEALLLGRAVARPGRIESLLRWWNRESSNPAEMDDDRDRDDGDHPAPAPPAHPLLLLADDYHATIVDLLQRATGSANDDADADDADADDAELGADAPG